MSSTLLPESPHVNSFVIGPAVIKQTHTGQAIERKGRSLASKIDTLVRHFIDPIYWIT
jgi:hypothetical protein